jgi:monoamine oxidase
MTSNNRARVARRDLLRTAAGASALAAAPALAQKAGGEAAGEQPLHDVIIIGGGFAGCTAARELGLKGRKCLILEAHTYLGGRTTTGDFAGHQTEFGGTWIHWSQPFVFAEVSRYGLGLSESPGAFPDTAAWMWGNDVRTDKALVHYQMIEDGCAKMCDVDGMQGRSVFPRPHEPFFTEEPAKYDGLSMIDRLKQLDIPAEQAGILSAFASINCHNDPAQGGMVDLLKWYALGDFNFGLLFDKLGHYKIREGTAAMIQALVADGKPEVKLSTAVTKVEHDAQGVTVTTEGGEVFKGRAAIVTVPMNVLKDVEFAPTLASGKLEASREGMTGRGNKFYFKINKNVGNFIGTAPYPYPISMFWTEDSTPDTTTLVAFGPPVGFDFFDQTELQKAIGKLLPGVEVIDVAGWNWAEDPYVQGTWCWYRPGQFTRHLAELQRTEGRLFFASADSADGWRGFIDGAVERGIRSARDAEKTLAA